MASSAHLGGAIRSKPVIDDAYRALHRIALQKLPVIDLDADTFAVGVLPHDRNPTACLSEDFLWFKVKSKHSVGKLKNAYLKRTDVGVNFKYGNTTADDVTQMRHLDTMIDHIVVFAAVDIMAVEPSPLCTSYEALPQLALLRLPIKKENRYGPHFPVAAVSRSSFPTTLNVPNEIRLPPLLSELPVIVKNESRRASSPEGHAHAVFSGVDSVLAAQLPAGHNSPLRSKPTSNHGPQSTTVDISHNAGEDQSRTDSILMHETQSYREPKAMKQIARLQILIEEASPDHLETEVRNSQRFLENLRQAFGEKGCQSPNSQHWVQQISNLQKKHKVDTPTIIGVVGNTGAGKSSVINALKEDLEDGKTVWAPSSKKRGRSAEPSKGRKKRKLIRSTNSDEGGPINDSDDDDAEAGDEGRNSQMISDSGSDSSAVSRKGDPLTLFTIDETISQLKENKKRARRERADMEAKAKILNEQLASLEKTKNDLEAAMSSTCIMRRNAYSRSAIQVDFAAGIKELDQENAQEADEANFNPDEDIRNYEEVARSLPVFCVSSRAYQKLGPPATGF
ncbi:uncharacterized protein BP5553_07621 [Venustampulla echinocandica]|uniref:Uncharacterized protein n=1 Tax=Venustampulla echinocandica TaxID=2656787 RepID=A0A370TH35_9HELO|nr:uncharacterized protein BP5553_07621 [Venustampulla echinocandica]RDL34493.1 hypothetical protein BP5553_07621 [Venustampulla echinocandica]